MKYDAIGVSLSSRVSCANWLKKQFSLIDACRIDCKAMRMDSQRQAEDYFQEPKRERMAAHNLGRSCGDEE